MKDHLNLRASFPWDVHPQMRIGQEVGIAHMQEHAHEGPVIHQAPVGSGKTALGYTFLRAHLEAGAKHPFFIAPNKSQVMQIGALHPDVLTVFGRNEHPCLYYGGEGLKADQIPCSLLTDCPHRVNQETGETHVTGATPCPYLQQKFDAKRKSGIIASTNAFFLYTVLFSREFEPGAVAIDEVHRLARAIRSVLTHDLTDWKIERAMEAVEETSPRQCAELARFLASMKRMVKWYALGKATLLETPQVERLYDALMRIDSRRLEDDARNAIKKGRVDPVADREVLQQVESIARSVRRFQRALKYAMSGNTPKGFPLNYVVAYGKTEMGERDKVQYRIRLEDYYVVPIIQKILPPAVYAFSGTIPNPEILGYETGIKGAYLSIPSDFPAENTRIYMPKDTKDLSFNKRNERDKTKMLRLIARAAKRFADKGLRSLVVIVSNEEHQKFLVLAKEEGLDTLSYGNGIPARECAQLFREGRGMCLVGTASNFGEGLDLPAQTAPIIFYYRPGYPRPEDPVTVFEERRFGRGGVWRLWKWRVMVELLQVRGRNVRSATDLGVTFLISQQFREFAFRALPEWLQSSYRGNYTFEECARDAENLLIS